jgi:hypothetical protein
VAGAAVLVAVPVLAGRGGHGNASSNPLDYPRNLLVTVGAITAGTAAAALLALLRTRSLRARSHRPRSGPARRVPKL